MSLSFNMLRWEHPRDSGPELQAMFDTLPEADQATCWTRLGITAQDRRFIRGELPLVSYRQRPRSKRARTYRPARSALTAQRDADWQRGTDALTAIPAETYLEILAPDSEPARGRCHCPTPGHDDRTPSCSYQDNRWHCFGCCAGGGIFQLGSALTGLADRGPDFNELRRWLAERLLGAGL